MREVRGACPLDCPDACGWIVGVRDGVATSLRGNPRHPFTQGVLCSKVNRYLEQAAHPERLLYPLRRVGSKGEGSFERISWDEALDEIAARLGSIVDRHGGQAIWPFWGTGTLGHLQGAGGRPGARLFNVLGASRHVSTICAIAGATGLFHALGDFATIDQEDLAYSKLILMWGSNPLSTGHHVWKFVQAARRNGAYLVAIDPVRTRSAEQADEHVAPLPGTDAALALGLAHVIVGLSAENRDFIERRTQGWPEFRERIAEFAPARAAEITGVPVDTIVRLGERIARTRPTAIRASMGLQRHAGGGAALRTLACLLGVTGDWELPGGGLSYTTSGHFKLDTRALHRDDLRPHPVRTLTSTTLGHVLLERTDPPVHALFVIAANPVASNPHQNLVRRGLAREDLFTVVLEHFATDTVDYADIVLPATMQHEHADLVSSYGHLYLAWNEPAVAAPGECLSGTETFRRLARRMELTDPCLYESDEQLAEQALASGHPWLEGISSTRLREEGFVRLSVPKPFVPFATQFPTQSGRLEFASDRAARAGLDRIAGYTPPLEVADAERALRYPLALVSVASHHFLNTIFANHPQLGHREGPLRVLLHPDDARVRAIESGERVRVHNDRGAFEALAEVSERVRPGVIATTKGHWLKRLAGSNANAVVDERDTDMGGGPVYHDTRVEISKP